MFSGVENKGEFKLVNDDLEEVDDIEEDINDNEADDVFSLSKWIQESISHVIFLIIVVFVIVGMIIGVKYVYDTLGNPNTHQQTGLGILEMEKD